MRLWHDELFSVLPNKMLIAQWRECVAIKRQWEKGSLASNKLVNYVLNYDKKVFSSYVLNLITELQERKIKYKPELLIELIEFSSEDSFTISRYPEHNDRYFKQCYYNLQEKHDRGIINETEWKLIYNLNKEFKEETDE